MIITISGMPGAGKSSVAKYLAKKLNLRYIYAGGIMRDIAKERGFSAKGNGFVEWEKFVEKNPDIDKKLDKRLLKEVEKGNCITDSVLAGYLIKKADLKIFLKVSLKDAAHRIALRERITDKTALSNIKNRIKIRQNRWKKLYKIDFKNLDPFDFVFDTTKFDKREVLKIMDKVISIIKSQRLRK